VAVESATYLNDLNTSYPPGTDPRSQGDDHLRLIKNVLKTTFPSVTGVFTELSHTWKASQIIQSDDAGAGLGPTLELYRNSASPAASDVLGGLTFTARDSAANKDTVARIYSILTDPTSTSEDADLLFGVITAGTLVDELRLSGAALFPNADAGLNLGAAGNRFGTAFVNTLNADAGGTLGDASGDTVVIKGTTVSAYMASLLSSANVGALRTAMGIGTTDTVVFGTVNLGTSLLLGGVNPFNSGIYTNSILNALGTSPKGTIIWKNTSSWDILGPP